MSRGGGGAPRALALALLLTLPLGGAPPATAQNQPDFFGLGDLPGGDVESGAFDVSADGTVVVGESVSGSGTEAFRWTEAGGMTGLGTLSGGDFFSAARGVSADGQVVAGTASNSDGGTAFRWTSGGGMVGLGQLSCSPLCAAPAFGAGISRDGQTVVGSGTHKTLFGDPHADALRWPGGGTSVSILDEPPGASGPGGHVEVGEGLDADATGAVIVGEAESGGDVRAVLWTGSGSTATVLPGPPGAIPNATAQAVSADGSVIVGATNTSASMATSLEAAMWSGPGGGTLTLLGDLGASSPRSRALDVTGDGGIVVGTARDAEGDDRAFIWDAASGMQDLAQVLADEYGIDVGGWHLREARGVSDPNAAGEFAVVGTGTNPSGEEEAWLAFLSPVACNDGEDNDLDGDTDWPADAGCTRLSDRSEVPDCSDGLDNDEDGDIDWPADAGCTAADDATELPDCGDGIDNDGDGLVDHPDDPGCRNPAHPVEDPACDDGVDNDGDGDVDFPADAGCLAGDDFSEVADCSDGIDGDGDGLVDFPADPECDDADDPAEDPHCSDRVDNDGDFRVDYPDAYPACLDPADGIEAPRCADGLDDDGDGFTDHPDDPECLSPGFGSEAPVFLAPGDLLVLDRGSDRLFRLDPGTGGQELVSESAGLTEPQGLAERASGELVVADPAGLFEVTPPTGAQRRFSDPLTFDESMQVVFDGAGDAIVLENEVLSRVAWTANGIGARTVLVTMPLSPEFFLFRGDSLVREPAGTLLVTAFGFSGDGVFRVDVDAVPPTASLVTSGLLNDQWADLALEADGTILAVGQRPSTGEAGVWRIDPDGPDMGTITPLSTDPAWVAPVGVAVAPGGDIYVADEGTCDASGCTGSEVVHVDPGSGARTPVGSGGFLTGPADLLVVSTVPRCQNGVDDDGDGFVDYPDDGQCLAPWDTSELPDCSDGDDDDGDGLVDYPDDPGCVNASSNVENPACDDGHDNDGDGLVDLADPGCRDATWIEAPDCNDGVDNDGDGLIDLADPQCGSAWKNREKKKKKCGLGAEPLALLPLWWVARRRRAGGSRR